MRVIVLNGYPRSGKDTFAEMCIKHNTGGGTILSMADRAKQLAKEAGWDGQKTPQNRKFLSKLKDLIDEWNDCSYTYVSDSIKSYFSLFLHEKSIVFVMAREPKDIERLVQDFNATTVLVKRESESAAVQSNHADAEVLNYDYDYVVHNNGSISDLEVLAKNLVFELNHVLKGVKEYEGICL